jgi:hypothetical protein
MPERGFDSGFWGDKWVRANTPHLRYLFIYLWTNDHCNQAGVYEITLETISFETSLPLTELPDLLRGMAPKVIWFPDQDLIWVRNFIKRQAKSPKFLIAAANCLKRIKNNGLVAEVLKYNLNHYRISIPYTYTTDTVSIPPDLSCPLPVSNSSSSAVKGVVEDEVVKGKGVEAKEQTPTSRTETGESLSPGDQEVISTWFSVSGFDVSPSAAAELAARMRTEFTDLNILEESKKWAVRKLSDPIAPKSRPASQLWNWMLKARQFANERRSEEHGGNRKRPGVQYARRPPGPTKPVRVIDGDTGEITYQG